MRAQKDILEWYQLAGVTEAIGEVPVNRLQAENTPTIKARIDPLNNLINDARQGAQNAADLNQLKQLLLSFDGCALKKTATQRVFGVGVLNPDVMCVGEAPGSDEDRFGEPFVGESGQLLEKALNAVGLSRKTNTYISNIIPWRPPGNRTPSQSEIAMCLPFIHRHIELVKPKVLVCLGAVALNALMETNESISKVRGHWMTYTRNGQNIPTMAVFHPAYLLRTPPQKKWFSNDLLTLRQRLDGQLVK